jgi:hypothetical protein
VQVKLLAEDGELYVFAQSHDRVTKERAMRRPRGDGVKVWLTRNSPKITEDWRGIGGDRESKFQ